MPRLLRYLLIWLSCTAASVTAVIVTIHFVVGSTRPTAPVAQSAPEDLPAATRPASPPPSPSPSPSRSTRTPRPTPTRTAETSPEPSAPRTPTARPTPRPAETGGSDAGCTEAGSGVHTVPAQGGKTTVRFGGGRVCLISAVPNRGFTVSTRQTSPQALTVTFSGGRQRSEVTATAGSPDRVSVRETSF
ncbi:hypothetical protein ACF1DW_21765 [Streptomyces sp. NPDC014603]|uniref:hypothetical protein n=1 Tax=Streptomyces sp. NPDC014603 TaxID=3364873 RepID=UPI0036F82F71